MAKVITLQGNAKVFGDYIDAYQILPEQYWKGGTKIGSLSAEELGKYAMEGVDPQFAAEALTGKYSFIVAGRNFGGGGKSIEHPVFAIKGAQVKAVLAESFSRYFFRNAINNGLLVMVCPGITTQVKTGDTLEITPMRGEIHNTATKVRMAADPLPEIALEILTMGGYIPYIKKKMAM